jgi:anti-sigma factor RsiW
MKNCFSDGALRAYFDRELDPAERLELERHLAECPSCGARFQTFSTTSIRIDTLLGSLDAPPSPAEQNPQMALARFKASLAVQDQYPPFFTRVFSSRWRLAWAASLAAAILLLSLAFPSARGFAQRLLATLRVEKVQTINLDLNSLDGKINRRVQQGIAQMISDKAVVTTDEKAMSAASQESASNLAGFPVRLLSARQDAPHFEIEGAHAFHMTVDRARLQDFLDQAGRPDLVLPATLDGATVSVQVPRFARVSYGNCGHFDAGDGQQGSSSDPTPAKDCLHLVEAPSPLVNVPSDLNLQQLAETVLGLAGMNPVQARKFCQTVDWKSTLVLPVPSSVRSYESVDVNGVTGTLMYTSGRRSPSYVLIWVKDGIIYCLVGMGDPSQAVQLADSLD